MNLRATLFRRFSRLNLPIAALTALLQRSPAVRLIAAGTDYVTASPVGAVLRSAAAAAASLGALNALSGATTLIESNNLSSLSLPAGSAMQPVIFGVNNTINIGSWRVTGSLPPGLSLVAAEGGASLSGPGILDATNVKNNILQTTPILQGTPTTPGSYTFTLQAFESAALQGLASNVFSYTVTVTGTASGGGTSGGGGSSGGGTTTPAPVLQPVAQVTVDGHSNGDTITLAAGASGLFQVTVRYSATDTGKNLSGIRFNLWNPPAGSTTPFAGLFSSGSGLFFSVAGGYGEVDQNVTLTPGDWYFWTDAQDAGGNSSSTGAWTSGYVLHVAQGTGATTSTKAAASTLPADLPPNAVVAVDGHSNGDTLTISKGGSVSVTIRYAATDATNNLSGIRYNMWNPPAGNTTPFAGFFSNGSGFVPQSGGSGEVTQIMNLTAGDWYFWTDAQNSNGDAASTGGWTAGYILHVVSP
jgi:hypothetical protein